MDLLQRYTGKSQQADNNQKFQQNLNEQKNLIYDYLERGVGKEYPAPFIQCPEKPRKHSDPKFRLKRCKFEKIEKKKGFNSAFKMYSEDNPNLFLYAELEKNGKYFLIYSYKKFDPYFDHSQPLFKFCAHSNLKTYTLWNLKCDNCYFNAYKQSQQKCSKLNQYSQQLACFDHFIKDMQNQFIHVVNVLIPKLNGDLLKPQVICPRTIQQLYQQQQQNETNKKNSPERQQKQEENNDNSNIEQEKQNDQQQQQNTPINNSNLNIKQQLEPLVQDFSYRKFTEKMHLSEKYPEDCYYLRTKLPIWSSIHKAWTINSNGRMKKSSKRNFQLMFHQDDQKEVLFQMGKEDTGVFIVDYQHPISFIQAMAFALSTFNWKASLEDQQKALKKK